MHSTPLARLAAVSTGFARGWPRILALLLCTNGGVVGCGSAQKRDVSAGSRDPDAVRYRLLLRENPVDSAGAFRCYGGCQSAQSPDAYVDCLSACPGFERHSGFRCEDHEVPPVAACLTARKVPLGKEPDPGLVVLSVIAGTAIVVSLASVCASSPSSQCGYAPGLYPVQ